MLIHRLFYLALIGFITGNIQGSGRNACDSDGFVRTTASTSGGQRYFNPSQDGLSAETRRRYERLSHLVPGSHIPVGFPVWENFDHTFSGIRVSRCGSIVRVGRREYKILPERMTEMGVSKRVIEVVSACTNAEETISYFLPIASFIDTKVNFLCGTRGFPTFPPIEETIAGVRIHSSPGQISIGSHVYSVSDNKIVLEYCNRNPNGFFINIDIVPFIESTISKIREREKANTQKTRSIEKNEERKVKHEEAAKLRIERKAEALGVSEYATYEQKKAAVVRDAKEKAEKEMEERRQDREQYLIRCKERADREKQRKEEDDRLILAAASRKPGERIDYQEHLRERHAFASRGVFDASLSRTTDDLAFNAMRASHTRTSEDVIKEVKKKYGMK